MLLCLVSENLFEEQLYYNYYSIITSYYLGQSRLNNEIGGKNPQSFFSLHKAGS